MFNTIKSNHIISYTRTPFVCAGRRTTDATNQQTTKWLAYYKCFKSRLAYYKDLYSIVPVYVFGRHMFSYHPFYFDFHSARVIFYVSSGFYFWNVNRTSTWLLSKMFKVAFKDVSTKNSEPTCWTILFA